MRLIAATALALAIAATRFDDGTSQAVPSTDLRKRFDEACAALDGRTKQFNEMLRACKTADERNALQQKRPGLADLPVFEAYAAEGKGTELAAEAWMRVAEIAADFRERDRCVRAFDRLIEDHANSPVLIHLPVLIDKGLGGFNGFVEPTRLEEAMKIVANTNPNATVRAVALYAGVTSIVFDPKATPDRIASARVMLASLIETYPNERDWSKRTYSSLARGVLTRLDRLAVGCIAPDFDAVDENGVKFKLSDYRGKIVLVDFWGTW